MSKQRIEPNMAVDAVPNKVVSPEKPEFSLIDENMLESRIHTIRGLKVMLDADLAKIYGYSTKDFNRQVKNNIDRFAEDFRFQLTKKEVEELFKVQFAPSGRTGLGTRTLFLYDRRHLRFKAL